ncbi:unnamed protein product, partial [Polarella glacialis]
IQPLATAPAQVHSDEGFIRRSVLNSLEGHEKALQAAGAGAESVPLDADGPSSSGSTGSPGRRAPQAAPVQRPSSSAAQPSTPLMTPSPTGNSMFSAARYQLFGGPAPLQELSPAP